MRSRVLVNQVLPFAAIVMVLFAFALDSDDLLTRVAPGLVWLATLFSMLVVVQRSFAVEAADGALDALRTAGVPAQGIYFGKAIALALQLVVLEVLLFLAAFVLYNSRVGADGVALLITSASRFLRAGVGRYALWRSHHRNQRSRITAAIAVVAGRGASSDRCNPSDGSGARRRRNLDA